MNEASKTRALWGDLENTIIQGKGIDIGCGPDPISETARPFDQSEGDANEISKYVNESFDYVFSSHCLEHMHHPEKAIKEWWSLVKPGGHMIILVPDEDLYELGYFPSLFNDDHKATFTVSKRKSWSPVSYNVLDLARSLDKAEIVKLEQQDSGLYRDSLAHRRYSPKNAKRMIKFAKRLAKLTKYIGWDRRIVSRAFGVPYDQTAFQPDALAQIQLIVKKID